MLEFLFLQKDKKLRVENKVPEIEPQEVFLDNLAAKKAKEITQEYKLETPLPKRILKFMALLLFFSFLIFGAKTIELQIISKEQWQVLAKKNGIREILLIPERGVIYERNFVQLVSNRPSFDLICDKRDMPSSKNKLEKMLVTFSQILQLNFDELKRDFDENPNPLMLVEENLSHQELVVLQAKISELKGCQIQENQRREYEKGEVFSHLLGYTAKISKEELASLSNYSVADQIGKDGVEKSYEKILRGTPGKIVIEKDAFGNKLGERKESDPIPGSSVVLWLDAGLQEAIFNSLLQVFRETGSQKAAAVALDPRSGGVLALLSLPSFNNNLFSQGISSQDWEKLSQNAFGPLFNRAIAGLGYPTGSVIKPLLGVAALEEKIIDENTWIFAPLEICIENIYTKQQECFKDWTFHGNSDLKRAIAESVNTFFYMIGGGYKDIKGLGANKIKEYIERFGWGKLTHIDLPGEGSGVLPDIDSSWRLGDTYHLSIGQGPFAITPLQVAVAFEAIANGGKLIKPQVVKAIVDSKKNMVKEFPSQVLSENFVDPKNIQVVRKAMRQTVTAGSATGFLDTLPVKVAAKTGTAQTGRKAWDGKDLLYSWTVAFAPFEDPEIVLVVVVEDVKEGSVAALPVVRDALQWYFSR